MRLLLLALLAMLPVWSQAQATKPAPSSASSTRDVAREERLAVGRWQVVHGPPTGLYRTFLIDTVTGETFIVCGDPKGVEGWCRMYKAEQSQEQKAP